MLKPPKEGISTDQDVMYYAFIMILNSLRGAYEMIICILVESLIYVGGQSEFPEGLLFGGSERESGTQLLIDTLTSEGVSRSNQALQRVMRKSANIESIESLCSWISAVFATYL